MNKEMNKLFEGELDAKSFDYIKNPYGVTEKQLSEFIRSIQIERFVPLNIGTGRKGARQIFRNLLSEGWHKDLIRKCVTKHGGFYMFNAPKI